MSDAAVRTITDQVHAGLRDLILRGTLVPGEKIDQAELAKQFGTSLIPIREALARLRASGLVSIVPRRGAFVQPLSGEELLDIYFVRELLEEQAARLAADHLTDFDITRLEDLVRQMEQATAAADYMALLELNRQFHFTIYNTARRRHLLQIIEQLWDQSDRYRRVYTRIPERAKTALFEHQAILAACRVRDGDAMGETVRHNVHQTTTGLLEKIRAEEIEAR